jgi:bacterioferritin-associated ferredoxin
MQNNHSNQPNEVICFCSGTTKQQIKQLIDNGMDTLTRIAHETGASTGCGSCDYLIMEMISENKPKTR